METVGGASDVTLQLPAIPTPQQLLFIATDGTKLSQVLCSPLPSKGNTSLFVEPNACQSFSTPPFLSCPKTNQTTMDLATKTHCSWPSHRFSSVLYIDRTACLVHLLKTSYLFILLNPCSWEAESRGSPKFEASLS